MRRLLIAGVAAVAALGLVGTAGGAGASAPVKKKPPVKLKGKVNNHGTKSLKGNSITLEEDDFYISPTFIKGKPGQTVTVKVKNEGKNQHSFTIDSLKIDQVIDPDKSMTITVQIPADGSPLVFYCHFHGGPSPTVSQYGMQGAFFTKAGGSAGAKTTKSTSSSGGGGSGY